MNSNILEHRTPSGRLAGSIILALYVLLGARAITSTAQSSTVGFSFPDSGGATMKTTGASPMTSVGYARINQSAAIGAGFATISLRQNGVLVSESTVPAADLVNEGRIYVEIGGGFNTGIAIVNDNDDAVQLASYFTDSSGISFGASVQTLPAHHQIAQFLSEPPFNAPSQLVGTFTFFTLRSASEQRVGAIALRGFVNERGDFLMTTLPIAPVGQRGLYSGGVLPHFAAGDGWSTHVVLINPTETELAGTITFRDPAGEPSPIDSERGTGSSFDYRVPAKSAWRLRTSNRGPLRVGSVRIGTSVPMTDIPIAFLIFSSQPGTTTVASAGVGPVRPASAMRLYAESSTLRQTGLAISNVDTTVPVRVTFDLTTLMGEPTGFRGELNIPAAGQAALFLRDIPGFAALPDSFQGVLHISAPSGSIAVIGLRGLYNERGEFLISSLPAINDNDEYFKLTLQYADFIFPHFVDGAGYVTQFVLMSGWTPGPVDGTLEFLTQAGAPYPATLPPR